MAHTHAEAARGAEEARGRHAGMERFAEIAERSNDALFTVDQEWRITFVNEAAAAAVGRSIADLLHATVTDFFPPEDRRRWERNLARAMEEQVDTRFLAAYGRVAGYWDVQVFPIKGELAIVGRDITEQHEQEERALRELERTRLLQQVAVAATTQLGLAATAGSILDAMRETPSIRGAGMAVLNEHSDELDVIGAFGDTPQLRELPLKVDGNSLFARSARERRLLTHDDEPEGEPDALADKRYFVSPMEVGDAVVGVFSLAFAGRRDFTPSEVESFHALGHLLGQAVDNARLFEATTDFARRMAVLRRIAETASSTLDLRDVAGRLADAASQLLSARGAALMLEDPNHENLNVVGAVGHSAEFWAKMTPVPTGSQTLLVRDTARPRYIEDFDTAALNETSRSIAKTAGARSTALLPLIGQGRVIGVLSVTWAGAHKFDDDERAFLESMAAEIGVGLQNALLFQSETVRRQRIEALHEVIEVAVTAFDPSEAAQNVLDYLVERHGFDFANAWIGNEDELQLVATSGFPEDYASHYSPMPLASSYDSPKAFRSGKPIVVPDAKYANPAVRQMYAAIGMEIGAYVTQPMRSRGRVIGTLNLGWRSPHTISQEDVEFYASIGGELGVVLENARLYETEREIADRLQEALLALPEQVEGLEFAHAYHSAAEAARVGGDFYDIFEMERDLIGVTIGDVAGKGVEASVLTSLVKNTIRAHANEKGATPARILHLTNDIVFKATGPESFVTVFFAVLDRSDGRIVYANAGHTTAALVSGDGSVVRMPGTGPLLGAFTSATFEQAEMCCLEGSNLLFLYTDGLTEARRGRELYGEPRLLQLLETLGGATPTDVVRRVIDNVVSFASHRLRDDLAILAVRRAGGGRVAPAQERLPL